MKSISFRFLSLILSFIIIFCLYACDSTPDDTDTADTESSSLIDTPIRIMVLSGTTGFGMAPLMDANANGTSILKYTFSVENDASVISPALLNGTCDIAALPTNAAAVLYSKKSESIRILAVNTLGVLYVVTNSNTDVHSFEDLRGKTVYCPAQNPTFIFNALCQRNGLTPGTDITVDNAYAQPADLRTALATGKIDIAVLPEPMVTIALSANSDLHVALDLTVEWENTFGSSAALTQGCVVVNSAFAQAHPEAVDAFLREYEASVQYVRQNPESASGMIVEQGIFTKASVAEKAIPQCNLCFIKGREMADKLNSFYQILYEVAPSSVGGQIPDEKIFYFGE